MSASIFPSLVTKRPAQLPIPTSYAHANFSITAHAVATVSTRQTKLEPAASTVDRAISWSFWIRPANALTGSTRIFQVGDTGGASNIQYACNIQPTSLQSSANGVLNFTIYTTFTSAFINCQTSFRIKKGRWQHIVITKSAVESNTAFEIYVNGVKDTSLVRTSGGTYTGALNNAAYRFSLSTALTAGRFAGNIKDLAIWKTELNQTQVDELYNSGVPIDVSTVTNYGTNIEAYWPLSSDLVCANDSNCSFGSSSNVNHSSSPIGPNYEQLSVYNAYPANTTYKAFGALIRPSGGNPYWLGRDGTTHLANGNIIKVAQNIAAMSAGTPVTVIDDGTYDVRGCSVANVDTGQLIVFASRFTGPSTWIDASRWESTDGVVGETYGSPSQFTMTYGHYNFYGRPCFGYNGDELWVPQFETDNTNFIVNMFKRTAGVWSKQVIWTGTTEGLTETALLRAGNNTFITLSRSNTLGGLYMMYSTNGGSTWSSPVLTNLAGTSATLHSMADLCLDAYGRIVVVWADRTENRIRISVNNSLAAVIANPSSGWNAGSIIFESYSTDSFGVLGYPQIVRVDTWHFAIAFSAEFSSSRADLYMGYGRID